MKDFSVFDIIGPRMVGPSSSHTAGAVRIGLVARSFIKGHISSVEITLYGSFADTGRGHGTDRAIVAGILGVEPDDPRIKYSMLLAKSEDMAVTVNYSHEPTDHPNTARIKVTGDDNKSFTMVGISIGGGNIRIIEINGMEVSFGGDYPTLIAFYNDVPGVISKVSTVLAAMNINIAFMRVFRQAKRKEACMVIETDAIINGEVLDVLSNCVEEIAEVCAI